MFEQLIAEAASRLNMSAASVSALVRGLLGLMTNTQTGGPEGLVGMFRKAGLGETLSSWFGGREGRLVTANQVESVLGPNILSSLATSSGLTMPAASTATAFILPKLISLVTPSGTMPSANSLLSQVSGYLDRPISLPSLKSERRGWPRWLPWAVAAALALVAWSALRGPAGTIDPQLTLSNRDGRVTYSGVVRDEATRTSIVSALQTAFGAANVEGTLKIDPRVKRAAWLPRLGDLTSALNMPGVDFSLNGDVVNLGGWLSAVQRQSLMDKLKGVFGARATIGALGDAATSAVRTANDKALSALAAIGVGASAASLADAMNLSIVNFATGSAEIPADNMEIIRRSAEALKRAPAGTTLEIGGHTDNTGDAASNITLSQQRADAVKNALTSAGVPPAMLTTRGYGDARPRASNETEYGRFQNRRIEYSVVQ